MGFTFYELSQPVLQSFSRNLTSDTITDKKGPFLSRDKKMSFQWIQETLFRNILTKLKKSFNDLLIEQ